MIKFIKKELKIVVLFLLVIFTLTTCTLTGTLNWNLGQQTNSFDSSSNSSSISSSVQQVKLDPFLITISVERLPNRLDFTPGEQIDPTGGIVRIFLSDGSSFTAALEKAMLNFNPLNLASLGRQSIEVRYFYNGVVKTTTYQVNIVSVVIGLTSIGLDLADTTLRVGQSLKINPILNPANSTINRFSWTSSNQAVVFVSQEGLLTALKVGSSQISVTADGKTISVVISVIEPQTSNPPQNIINEIINIEEYVYNGYLPIDNPKQLNQIRYYDQPFEAVFGANDEIKVIFDGREALDGKYILINSIDFGTLDPAVDDWYDFTQGWNPIGDSVNSFNGTFQGNYNLIFDLYINRDADNLGLFGYGSGLFSNVAFLNTSPNSNEQKGKIIGNDYIAVLLGYADNNVTISNLIISDYEVSGEDYVALVIGGVGEAGFSANYNLSNISLTVNKVFGQDEVGLIAGDLYGNILLDFVFMDSNQISGQYSVGALVGYLSSSTVRINFLNINGLTIYLNEYDYSERLHEFSGIGGLFGYVNFSNINMQYNLLLNIVIIHIPYNEFGLEINSSSKLTLTNIGGLIGYAYNSSLIILNTEVSSQVLLFISSDIEINAVGGLIGYINSSNINAFVLESSNYFGVMFFNDDNEIKFNANVSNLSGGIGESINSNVFMTLSKIESLLEITAVGTVLTTSLNSTPSLDSSTFEKIGGFIGSIKGSTQNLVIIDSTFETSVFINDSNIVFDQVQFSTNNTNYRKIGSLIGSVEINEEHLFGTINSFLTVFISKSLFTGNRIDPITILQSLKIIDQNTDAFEANHMEDIGIMFGKIKSPDVTISEIEVYDTNVANASAMEIFAFTTLLDKTAIINNVGTVAGQVVATNSNEFGDSYYSINRSFNIKGSKFFPRIKVKINPFASNSFSPTGSKVGGVFGYVNNHSVQMNIINFGGGIDGPNHTSVGGLIGLAYNSEIDIYNSYAANDINHNIGINALRNIGGIIGSTENSKINLSRVTNGFNLFSNATTLQVSNIGGLIGLIGLNAGGSSTDFVNISESSNGYASGKSSFVINETKIRANINASGGNVGGLVGFNHLTAELVIEYSFNQGNISSQQSSKVGGLVGETRGSLYINSSFSNSTILAKSNIGGLLGLDNSPPNNGIIQRRAIISNSYAVGKIIKNLDQDPFFENYSVGGIVGYSNSNNGSKFVSNYYLDDLFSLIDDNENPLPINDGYTTDLLTEFAINSSQNIKASASNLKNLEFFTLWPIHVKWFINPNYIDEFGKRFNDGYPMLRSFYINDLS
jgi:hypothetical protein